MNAQNPASSLTFLLIGLGNPGREYRETRHNVGFMAIDRLCASFDIKLSRMQSKALVGTGHWNETKIVLAKPQTFMNLSGQAVGGLVHFYKVPLTQLLVIHDEIDLPLGTLRIRPAGGSGGNRGQASIIDQLGTQDYPRLRIGVGRPPGQMQAADYVLQNFSSGDQALLKDVLDHAVEAARTFIQDGLEKAMNLYNGSILKE